jgi:hypothetical protein
MLSIFFQFASDLAECHSYGWREAVRQQRGFASVTGAPLGAWLLFVLFPVKGTLVFWPPSGRGRMGDGYSPFHRRISSSAWRLLMFVVESMRVGPSRLRWSSWNISTAYLPLGCRLMSAKKSGAFVEYTVVMGDRPMRCVGVSFI